MRIAKSVQHCLGGGARAGVIDTRISTDGMIRRRRRCEKCGIKWTSIEQRAGLKKGATIKTYLSQRKEVLKQEVQEEMQDALRVLFGMGRPRARPKPLTRRMDGVDIDRVHRLKKTA